MTGLNVLTYNYVEDVLDRRKPHREAHLEHARRWSDERGLVIAGATGNPPTGALFVFEGDRAEVEAFVAADPYVDAGLVASSEIEPWNVVAHRSFDEPLA